jgi:hypothetical protein
MQRAVKERRPCCSCSAAQSCESSMHEDGTPQTLSMPPHMQWLGRSSGRAARAAQPSPANISAAHGEPYKRTVFSNIANKLAARRELPSLHGAEQPTGATQSSPASSNTSAIRQLPPINCVGLRQLQDNLQAKLPVALGYSAPLQTHHPSSPNSSISLLEPTHQ